MRVSPLRLLAPLAALALAPAAPVLAQSYQGAGPETGDAAAEEEGEAPPRTAIQPYIEASQILTWQFDPVSDVLTYTQLAAGVDAAIVGRNNGGTVSLRYERNFGWGGDAADSDTLTGLARAYASIVPRQLTIEAGGLASRTRFDGGGGAVINPLIDEDFTTRTYAAYAGPSLTTRAGDVDITGNYRIGYTRVDSPDVVTVDNGLVDLFDESVTHSANVRAATSPGEPLPVGLGAGAGYFQEDVDNLDQRVRDAYVRGDVTVPVTPTLAIVGGIGAEDVEVSSRDALRDADGDLVIGPDGRLVTDESSPRVIAYQADGLIWDVGVLWRPSRRTQLQATFGHRYDSETFYGSFTWQPDRDTNVGVAVYDGISGFGGRITNALAALPTDFEVIRDPITGDIIGCDTGLDGQNCLGGLLGSIRSAVFRGRGVTAGYSRQLGRMTASVGAGYDNRRFIAAEGTVLAAADGVVDETWYVYGNLRGRAGPRGTYSVNTYANWFDSGVPLGGDVFALGTSVAYSHALTAKLSARAAIALSLLDSDLSQADIRTATALAGLRYEF